MRTLILFFLLLLSLAATASGEDVINDAYIGGGAWFAPNTNLTIMGEGGKPVGTLTWETGELVFAGKADESAKMFFNEFLKPMVDSYIKEQLKGKE
jgi:hypothetical protein